MRRALSNQVHLIVKKRQSTHDVLMQPWRTFSTKTGERPGMVEHHSGERMTRSRRRTGRLTNAEEIPSYKEFVHRFTVLSLYRNFLKTIRDMPHNQEDLRLQVRQEFRAHKDLNDPYNLQRALAEGKRKYKELQEFTGSNKKYDGDSWVNIEDAEDPRGRVGTGWPWQQ
jgi:hypothetical protein